MTGLYHIRREKTRVYKVVFRLCTRLIASGVIAPVRFAIPKALLLIPAGAAQGYNKNQIFKKVLL